ncbi:ribbon-helix-helix domain-containing protein [Clostridioides difficile]|nr:ribbon-helix-helix domain-containing protein [Clostridioides difficile]HBF6482864.1 ribbon-helix-helix domain-containing protein [Clostridioides difficile]HBF6528992.1 ribbon-helix-helix domain-containing protein [Clostridioides difficile]HBG7860118.1 ribbon-helix-helix domain-containing protein [Clostridioides difficile]
MKHEKITLRIPEDLYKALIDLSSETGIPVTYIIISAIWQYLSNVRRPM